MCRIPGQRFVTATVAMLPKNPNRVAGLPGASVGHESGEGTRDGDGDGKGGRGGGGDGDGDGVVVGDGVGVGSGDRDGDDEDGKEDSAMDVSNADMGFTLATYPTFTMASEQWVPGFVDEMAMLRNIHQSFNSKFAATKFAQSVGRTANNPNELVVTLPMYTWLRASNTQVSKFAETEDENLMKVKTLLLTEARFERRRPRGRTETDAVGESGKGGAGKGGAGKSNEGDDGEAKGEGGGEKRRSEGGSAGRVRGSADDGARRGQEEDQGERPGLLGLGLAQGPGGDGELGETIALTKKSTKVRRREGQRVL